MSELIATTTRLFIREIEDGDEELVYNLSRESSLLPNMQKDSEYEELSRKVNWDETNNPNTYNGMIFLRDNGAFVGKICMQYTNRAIPELGINILKAYQNHGYGPEAIIAFCNWYSATHGLSKVKVRISIENDHSIHIFGKLGAEYNQTTSYLSKDVLDMLREKLPGADMTALEQNSVRDYFLLLPFCEEE